MYCPHVCREQADQGQVRILGTGTFTFSSLLFLSKSEVGGRGLVCPTFVAEGRRPRSQGHSAPGVCSDVPLKTPCPPREVLLEVPPSGAASGVTRSLEEPGVLLKSLWLV